MDTQTMKIKCEVEGVEEAATQISNLNDELYGFPPQVTIRGCHDCKINIWPSQTKMVSIEGIRQDADPEE